MDSLKYSLIGITALMLILCIREYESRFALLLRIAVTVGLAFVSSSMLGVLYTYVKNNYSWLKMSEDSGRIFDIMLKTTGISFIGCICSGICRDSGESSIANSIESICKLEIILLCIPIIDFIAEKAQNILY